MPFWYILHEMTLEFENREHTKIILPLVTTEGQNLAQRM